MAGFFSKIYFFLCLMPLLVFGVIIESDKMDAIVPYVDEETWVFIDVDNTLIEPCQQIGSSQWREHIRDKARSLGCSEDEVESILDKFWLFVQPFVPVRLVDPKASDLLRLLNQSNVRTCALTAREPIESKHTQKQLNSVDLSFFCDFFPEKALLPADQPALFEKGVIYCGNNTKGEALNAFFEAAGTLPKKVVFIDDSLKQVTALEKTLIDKEIEFVGIRFSGADERVKAFDGDIADIQFSHLPKIISDEEAKKILTPSSS